jgi:ankyrin repeat protein
MLKLDKDIFAEICAKLNYVSCISLLSTNKSLHEDSEMKSLIAVLRAKKQPLEDLMMAAMYYKDDAMLKIILNSKLNWDKLLDSDMLCYASRFGNLKIVELCLKKNTSQDSLTDAVGCAVQNGHISIIKLLLQKYKKMTLGLLMLAIEKDNTEIVELFLERVYYDRNADLLCKASMLGHVDTVKLLLNYFEYDEIELGRALKTACHHSRPDVILILLEARTVYSSKLFALVVHKAYKKGYSKIIDLLSKDANNYLSEHYQLAFDSACRGFQVELVKSLLSNSSFSPILTYTTFKNACLFGQTELVNVILSDHRLERVLDPMLDSRAEDIIFAACESGNEDLVSAILNNERFKLQTDANFTIHELLTLNLLNDKLLKVLLTHPKSSFKMEHNTDENILKLLFENKFNY